MQGICELAKGTELVFQGTVIKREETGMFTYYIIKTKKLNQRDISMQMQIFLEGDEELTIGSTVSGSGYVKPFSTAANPGEFDERSYKQGLGILLALERTELESIGEPFLPWREYLNQLRRYLANIYSTLFEEKNASLASAMVLGDKKNLDSDIKALYQRNGIAHLIAISGLHIAMIGGTLYKILRKLTGSYPVAAVVGASFIVAYGVMTGLSGATLRAVVMLGVSIGADVVGRRYDGLTAIALALFVMLISNPYQITQAGFLLSFGAVIGITLIQPLWKQLFPKLPKCLDGFFVSISVQMVLLPVMLYYFYEVPVYGVFLNVLVVPLMSVLLSVLIVCGLLGGFSTTLAVVPATIANVIFTLYESLCNISEQVPLHTVCIGKPTIWWIALYYILLGMCLWASYGGKNRFIILGISFFFLLFGVFLLPSNVLVCVLDVGQGDGIYIRTSNHKHILVDGGSSSKQNVGQYVLKNSLKYYGAGNLDYVFVSHIDNDHYSGIKELLEKNVMEIDNLVLPDISNRDEAYKELERLALSKGCTLYYMKKGDYLKIDEITFTCLNPFRQIYDNKNAGSIVLQMTYGEFDMLLTGDIDAEGERLLLHSIVGSIEVLKVAHHGSDTSSSEAFVKGVQPIVACVSVGENNQYGHPAKEVMERLEQFASNIYLTKDCGAITIETDGNKYAVSTYLE